MDVPKLPPIAPPLTPENPHVTVDPHFMADGHNAPQPMAIHTQVLLTCIPTMLPMLPMRFQPGLSIIPLGIHMVHHQFPLTLLLLPKEPRFA